MLSALKENFSDRNSNICSYSELECAQKFSSYFRHPNRIPYWVFDALLSVSFFLAYTLTVKSN